ncbi:MAG: SOS response-associated peptidase [Alphaproteobacteria bacterium]|nr:SOS response-associated peptidase [Alphaproteobacteria bacterium]
MCGRYTLTTPAEVLHDVFGFVERPNLPARYNIAPSQEAPVMRQRRQPKGERTVQSLRWGLIPSWAKDARIASSLINARAETLSSRPAFAKALRQRRCAALADGFYDWSGEGAARQPYLVTRRDGAPFAFAGLWDRWIERRDGAATPVDTFTIVTTAANELLRQLHPRMPVILTGAALDAWLDPESNPVRIAAALRGAPSAALRYVPVSKRVNSARVDEPELAAPVGPETVGMDAGASIQ